jgi:uncharacterized caspase-like protein/uncharacterized protein YecT (DUF1311 family)
MLAWFVVAAGWLAAVLPTAAAERRVALVVGNSAYARVGALPNTVNDAHAVARALEGIGFDVALVADADRRALREALRGFAARADGADVAFLFYAGHGIEAGGVNWLIPTDAVLATNDDIADEAIGLDRVRAAMEGARRLRIVVLDACRDNPFLSRMKQEKRAASVGRGLARVEADGAEIIAFAAAEGRTAADGSGGNSPYTAALLRYLPQPGLDVRRLFGRVYDDVRQATGAEQEPAVYFPRMGGADVAIVSADEAARPPVAGPAGAGGGDPDAPARIAFQNAKAIGTAAEWDRFLAAFGQSRFAAAARDERARLDAVARPVDPDAEARVAFQNAKAIGTAAEWDRYLAAFGQSRFAAAARDERARLVALAPPPSDAGGFPSFCAGRQDEPVERLICADATVGALDLRLEVAYKALRQTTGDPDGLKRAQIAWIRDRERRCNLPHAGAQTAAELMYARPCVIEVTRARVQQLEAGRF